MYKIQVYFDKSFLAKIKKAAQRNNVSVSSYTRNLLRRELDCTKEITQPLELSKFAGLWQDYDISQGKLRSKAWGQTRIDS